jgi:hypothetical protein
VGRVNCTITNTPLPQLHSGLLWCQCSRQNLECLLSFKAHPGLGNNQSSLEAMGVPQAVPPMHLGLVLQEFGRVMTTDSAELRQKPHDFPWEIVICVTIIGLFSIPLFLWRSFQLVRNRLYVQREKQLALKLSTLIEEKCALLNKLSLVEKQREAACGKLDISKCKLEEVLLLETELIEEKCKHYTQVELNVEMTKTI